MSPITKRRIKYFRSNKRGLWSLWIFIFLFFISLIAEIIANDKPLLVIFDNKLFFPIFEFPLIVIILLIGALTFTFYFRFINIRGFMHSIDIIKGKYDNPNDTGQISHFQALTSALSATIGLGNSKFFFSSFNVA